MGLTPLTYEAKTLKSVDVVSHRFSVENKYFLIFWRTLSPQGELTKAVIYTLNCVKDISFSFPKETKPF